MGKSARHDPDLVIAELALLRFLVDRMPAMIAYWGADQRCRFANRAYEKWFAVNPEELVGTTLQELLGPIYPLNLPYIEAALRGEEQLFEREIPDPAGGPPRQSQAHYLPDVIDGEVRGFCVLVVDISRRKSAEEAVSTMARRLELAERLSSLGTLAAGVAHEINNPLAIVMTNLELAIEGAVTLGTSASVDEREALERAMVGARRVRDVVTKMKLLARGESGSGALTDVVECLESSIAASANALRYRGKLVCDFRPVAPVDADPAQLKQVFVHLLVNAADALDEANAATNEVHISTVTDEADVVVEIRDTGHGIPEGLIGRIFEPFFTTKDVGMGMGLGLSVAHGIVRSIGGSLSVESRVGEGSRFFVRLPQLRRDREPAPPEVRATPALRESPERVGQRRSVPRKRLSVLLIDDDEELGEVLQQVLATECDVTLLHDGREAIAKLVSPESDFDLVVCDLMMPDVSGMDVFEETSRTRPDLTNRFVFMTGGAFTPRSRAFVKSIRAPLLAKPFEMNVLRDLVATYRDAPAERLARAFPLWQRVVAPRVP